MTDPRDAEVLARSRLGCVLKDKWRLDALLGIGGMAAVYAATHRNSSRVAVKVLHLEYSVQPSFRQRFLREGYAANQVDHPGVVRIADDDATDDGAVFLVMELLDGETLHARWKRFGRRLPPVEVISAADQVLETLAAAHEKGIVHRDIKPQNLFLTTRGEVKILDFGIARLRESSEGGSGHTTQTGTVLGTPGFMAPEQARGRTNLVDAQTDLWAVGATMFTLLTGRMLHQAETQNERLLAAMTEPAPPLAAAMPGVPPALGHAVDRALAFDKAQRWPDARAMQAAVRQAYFACMGAPSADPVPTLDHTPQASLAQAAVVLAAQPTAASGPPEMTLRDEPRPDDTAIVAARTGGGVPAPPSRRRMLAAAALASATTLVLTVLLLSRGTPSTNAAVAPLATGLGAVARGAGNRARGAAAGLEPATTGAVADGTTKGSHAAGGGGSSTPSTASAGPAPKSAPPPKKPIDPFDLRR